MTAAAAGATFYFAWEPAFIIWLQAHLGVIGQAVVSFFSVFGEPVVTIGLIGFFYWGLDKELGKEIGISAALATVLNSTIKNVFIRRRPYFDHPEIKCLKAPEKGKNIYSLSAQGYSFPSGHSANVGSVFGSIIGYLKKRWVTAVSVTICAVVGFSRICLGVHYPTDVICGLAVALFPPSSYISWVRRLSISGSVTLSWQYWQSRARLSARARIISQAWACCSACWWAACSRRSWYGLKIRETSFG